jgi:hypothetical protein
VGCSSACCSDWSRRTLGARGFRAAHDYRRGGSAHVVATVRIDLSDPVAAVSGTREPAPAIGFLAGILERPPPATSGPPRRWSLATGNPTRMIEATTIDALSTIALLMAIALMYPTADLFCISCARRYRKTGRSSAIRSPTISHGPTPRSPICEVFTLLEQSYSLAPVPQLWPLKSPFQNLIKGYKAFAA